MKKRTHLFKINKSTYDFWRTEVTNPPLSFKTLMAAVKKAIANGSDDDFYIPIDVPTGRFLTKEEFERAKRKKAKKS